MRMGGTIYAWKSGFPVPFMRNSRYRLCVDNWSYPRSYQHVTGTIYAYQGFCHHSEHSWFNFLCASGRMKRYDDLYVMGVPCHAHLRYRLCVSADHMILSGNHGQDTYNVCFLSCTALARSCAWCVHYWMQSE